MTDRAFFEILVPCQWNVDAMDPEQTTPNMGPPIPKECLSEEEWNAQCREDGSYRA